MQNKRDIAIKASLLIALSIGPLAALYYLVPLPALAWGLIGFSAGIACLALAWTWQRQAEAYDRARRRHETMRGEHDIQMARIREELSR